MCVLRSIVRVLAVSIAMVTTLPALSAEQNSEKSEQPAATEAKKPLQLPEGTPRRQLAFVQQRLREIRQAALDANPELKKKSRELESMVTQLMHEYGHEPEKEEKRLQKLKAAIIAETDDFKRRKALSDEYRTKRLELAEARQKAMRDEKVRKTREALNKDILAAMKKQDPQTEALMAKAEELGEKTGPRIPPKR